MRCVAFISVRNGIEYIQTCLSHLVSNGIEVVIIDQFSTDGTYEVCQKFLSDGVCRLERVSYPGYFSLKDQLTKKQELIEKTKTDWVIHQDVDELLESPYSGLNLLESIKLEDASHYNAINFNELVFLPYGKSNFYESKHYYFFEPYAPRLMRAWKKTSGLSSMKTGGHRLEGNVFLSGTNYYLLHYIFTSQEHAYQKYGSRSFSKKEMDMGWHRNRINIAENKLTFPNKKLLQVRQVNANKEFELNDPWNKHYWDL